MRKLTVAQQLVDILRQAGVERIYGVVGDSLNSVVDTVRRTDGIEWVHVRNKEAGVGEFAQECVGQAVRPTVMTAASSTGPDRAAFRTSVLDAASRPSRMRPSCFTPKERLKFDLH